MVSSVSSLFRNRRPRPAGGLPKPASSPAVIVPESASSSIPTVEITAPVVEVDEDELVMASSTQDVFIPSSDSFSEDISIGSDRLYNGTNGESVKTVVIETDEDIPTVGCSEVFQNGIQSMKHAVEDLPPEYKEAARYSGLVSASLAGLFFSLVLFRILGHFLLDEPTGFFCSYFKRPFAPMFDALCHPAYPGFFQDFSQETRGLAGEIASGTSNFFYSIFAGFRAFGIIFWALFGGIFHVLCDGFHELWENVAENVTFLFKFICDFANALLGIFYRMIAGTIDQLGIAIQNVGHLLSGESHSSGWF